ncbi:MAG TPA: Rdx family protein [Methylomirabilota bacterium]
MRREAGRLKSELERDLHVSPRIKWGGYGQLDVLVDGRVVFSRKQMGRMPTSQELVALIRR